MDDKYDLRELIFSTFDDIIPPLLEGTPLEESAGSIAFGAATFAAEFSAADPVPAATAAAAPAAAGAAA